MLRAIKIQLYPNKTQSRYISGLLGSYRFVYNNCLATKKELWESRQETMGLTALGRYFHGELTKHPDYLWLADYNTKVLKQAVLNMLDAYRGFYKRGKGFPQFKSRKDNKQSCRFPVEAISKKNNYLSGKVSLTKELKGIKFRCSDKYKEYLEKNKAGIKSATLSKTSGGDYFLSFLVDGDLMRAPKAPINHSIGIDLGIKTFVVTSNGQEFDNLRSTRNNADKIAMLQRRLSNKVVGSKNRNKARLRLACFYDKLNNKKENYLHHVSNQLIDENQVVSIESLGVSGMMKNRKLARSLQELSLYRFKSMLRYKADWYGRELVEVDKFYASSKLCSNCEWKNEGLVLGDRSWVCGGCGERHDRDVNAAVNINREGLRLLEESKKENRAPLTRINAFGDGSISAVVELGNRNKDNFV